MDARSTDQAKWSHTDVARLLVSHNGLVELGLEEALIIVRRMHTVSVKRDAVLVQEGASNSNYMLLVLRGEGVVHSEGLKRADALVFGMVSAGQIIGEMGLLDGEMRSATVTASTDMDVAVLDKDALTQLIAHEPAAACKLLVTLLQRTSRRLRASNRKLRLMAQVNLKLEEELGMTPAGAPSRPAAPALPDNPLMF
ncbi:cyclic nucleotide-binding domain-containing protein [Polaromonas sp. YR568]|uniref:Crp/Fnr family transcriptional regulator n=1 Tax=Polaromonas sp. YR568 TaxID=1855301 RepID=UPI0031382722